MLSISGVIEVIISSNIRWEGESWARNVNINHQCYILSCRTTKTHLFTVYKYSGTPIYRGVLEKGNSRCKSRFCLMFLHGLICMLSLIWWRNGATVCDLRNVHLTIYIKRDDIYIYISAHFTDTTASTLTRFSAKNR